MRACPPSCPPSSSCPSSSSCRSSHSCLPSCPAIAVPRLLFLFPFDCACGGGARVGGRLVGRSGLARDRLVGEGMLVRESRASDSRRRGRCRQGGLWVLAITAGSRSCHQGVCHRAWHRDWCHQGRCRQGEFGILPSKQVRMRVLEAGQRRINLASGPCCGRPRSHARGSGSIGASRASQV